MKRRVMLLATGGTIASTIDETGAAVLSLSAADLAATVPPVPGVEVVPVDAEHIPSWNLDPPTMLRLARRVEEALADAYGVVVTHGTDTLEETAYLLDLTIHAEGPVVVTGAMRNASRLGADGPRNLEAALLVATEASAVGGGCYVVLGDEIHAAADVTKTHSTNPATFASPWLGPLGAVDGRTVALLRRPLPRRTYAVRHADAKVPLVKVAAGMDDALVRAALASGADGLVVEGTGEGHVPASWVPALRDAVFGGLPVVLTSRTFFGPVLPEYGGPGGGRDLRRSGLISGGRRSGLKARIELICALGAGLHGDELRAAFEGEVVDP